MVPKGRGLLLGLNAIAIARGGIEAVIMMIHWWRKPEYPEETTDLRQVADKLSHMRPVPSPRIEVGPQRCEATSSQVI